MDSRESRNDGYYKRTVDELETDGKKVAPFSNIII